MMTKQPPQIGEIWSLRSTRDLEDKTYLTILDRPNPNSRLYIVMDCGVIKKAFIVFQSDEWQKVA